MRRATAIARAVFGRLVVEVHPDQSRLVVAAATRCVELLCAAIQRHGQARVAFEAKPTSAGFFAALIKRSQIAKARWPDVTVFQLSENSPLRSAPNQRSLLHDALLRHVDVRQFHPLPAEPSDFVTCTALAAQLRDHPLDLIYAEIGESASLALNDPASADFADLSPIKLITLPPRTAFTLTLPVFRAARHLVITAAGASRASAIRATLHDPITTACPASLLRLHPHATLLLDPDAAALALPHLAA